MTTLKFQYLVESLDPDKKDGEVVEQFVPVPNDIMQDPKALQLTIQSYFVQFAVEGLITKGKNTYHHIPARRILDGRVEIPSIILADMSNMPPDAP